MSDLLLCRRAEHHRAVSVGLEVDADVEVDGAVVEVLDAGRGAGHRHVLWTGYRAGGASPQGASEDRDWGNMTETGAHGRDTQFQ